MSDVIIGDMLGFSKIATGTPSEFCREVHGGQMTYDSNPIIREGVGGQRKVLKGMSAVTTSCVCTGVAKADWALWLPGTLDLQIATMFECLAEVDDGTNGAEFLLTGGQPSKFGLSWTDAPDAEVEFTLDAVWALATEQAVGTDIPVYYTDATAAGYGPGDMSVVFGADPGVISINLQVDLLTQAHNTATVRAALAKTFPDSYHLTGVNPTCELITTEPLIITQLTDDEYTAGNIVVTLDNGVVADDAAITLTGMVCPNFNIRWEGGNGKVGFAHSFILGSSADVWGSAAVA